MNNQEIYRAQSLIIRNGQFNSLPRRLRHSLTTCLILVVALVAAVALTNEAWTAPVSAQSSDRPDGMRFVPDVEGQFRALADQRADPLGFHRGTSPNPSQCRHYQAITRVDGPDGTPFFLVTRSGNTPPTPGFDELNCDDSPGETRNGNLIVFRMGSREKHRERLRSNRLKKGVHVNGTKPPVEDIATIYFTFVGGDPNDPDPAKRPGLVFRDGENNFPDRGYQHPGGMQLIGNILAVALESPRPYPTTLCDLDPGNERCDFDPADDPTLVMFFDVSNPEAPIFKSQFAPVHDDGSPLSKTGVVAVTPLPGGLYLMAVTGGKTEFVFFYRSTIGDLSSPDLSWELVGSTSPEVDDDPPQTLQFLRQGDINGPLYLAGVRGHPVFGSDHDKLDLYRVECQTPDCAPGETISQPIRFRGQVFVTFPNTGGDRLANGAAASGFHITPSGELILYVTEHDNDGPDGTVKAGEWGHRDIVRDGSPTYLPSAIVNGPYEVDEGSSISLNGSAEPPITRAWFQFYHETEFRSFSPMVDYPDYDLDDFDDLPTLEFLIVPPGAPFTQNDKARSWKWFAPVGCSIAAINRVEGGLAARILNGTGLVESEPDLSQNFPDMYEKLDAVDFRDDCDQYYATPFLLRWDLDVNGSYETTGSPVTFDAIAFDGPSEVNVPAQAQHPSGGPIGQARARVTVRNVAPQLSQFHVTDGAGHQVNVEVPFVLTNLPVTAGAGFSDPGVLDHQTATLDWGDGSVEPQTAFTSFDEAFGDGTGAVSHTHRYTAAGSYSIALSVTDDDGGVDTEVTVVRVVTPEQAVEEIIAQIDSAIASTTDNNVRKDLEKARKALAGSNDHSNDGALNKIRDGNKQAAIAFLNQAIGWLRKAQAGGADVATQIALLEQVVAALSAT